MPDATFTAPDLTTFTGLHDLGLTVVGQRLDPHRAVLDCRVLDPDDWCRRCGCPGRSIGTVLRRLAHVPFSWRPTILRVRVRRYRCTGCGLVGRQDTTAAAEPRAKLSRGGLRWALVAIVCQHLTVARVAEALAVSWNCANDAVLAEGRRVLIADPARLEGVSAIGVDEHVWRHTRFGDKYVTVIIDLTPIRCGTGPARLLDMVEGRSAQVLAAWLAAQAQDWRDGVDVVAMVPREREVPPGFTGFKNAAAAELPEAVTVMDPFLHRKRVVPPVVRLAGQAWGHLPLAGEDDVRWRRQQELHSRRGRTRDPLYRARRVLHTGADLLTDRQKSRLRTLFSHGARGDDHVEVEATWALYQRMIAAYRHPDRAAGRTAMRDLIDSLNTKILATLREVRRLARTLNQRAADVLAYFDRPGISNGPTAAINGRLEHLRGSALGFRKLANYIARSLLEAGGFRAQLHPRS